MSELSNSALPNDIVADILVRLPVKAVGRFRCVSKPWQTLLLCPEFIKSHTKLHFLKPTGYLAIKPYMSVPCILTLATAESTGTATNDGVVSYLRSELQRFVVVGSCNGLLLLKSSSWQDIWLVNPITLESAYILDGRDSNMYYGICNYGLGYDSANDDYKIVSVSQNKESTGSVVDVYSLRMKCWKRISVNSPYAVNTDYTDRVSEGVYLNGCIHWLGFHTQGLGIAGWSCTIFSFDLAREEFVEGLFPNSIQKKLMGSDGVEEKYFREVMVFNGCLAAVSYVHEKRSMNLCVMREYGEPDSWTIFTTICPEVGEDGVFYDVVVCELNEDEIVLEKCKNYERRLVAYNWRNGMSRGLIIAGSPVCDLGFNRVTPFKGSLLSPNQLTSL